MGERVADGPCRAAVLPCRGDEGTPLPPMTLPHPHLPILCPRGVRWGPCQAPLTSTPVPVAMPVGFASVRCTAVFPPLLTVLLAQGRIQNPLSWPTRVHLGIGMAGDKNADSNHLKMIGSDQGTCARYSLTRFSYRVRKHCFTKENKEAKRLNCLAQAHSFLHPEDGIQTVPQPTALLSSSPCCSPGPGVAFYPVFSQPSL